MLPICGEASLTDSLATFVVPTPVGDLSVEEKEQVAKQTYHPLLSWNIFNLSDSQQLSLMEH